MKASPGPSLSFVEHALVQAQAEYREARAERAEAVVAARQVGLSHRQIGDALGVSESAVRGLIRRAVRPLNTAQENHA